MQITRLPRAVLFDLDGTLADTAPGLHVATSAALKEIGYPVCSIEETRSYLGNGPYMLLARAIAHSQNPDSEVLEGEKLKRACEVFNRVYGKECCHGDRVFPGVVQVLEQLGQLGIPRAVITNKPHEFVRPVLEKDGLLSSVDYYLGGGVIKERKPDPAPLCYVCHELGVNVADAVMVGDSWNDVEAARSAGMPSIALTYGYNRGVDIRESSPDYCFDDFAEIGRLLTKVGRENCVQ